MNDALFRLKPCIIAGESRHDERNGRMGRRRCRRAIAHHAKHRGALRLFRAIKRNVAALGMERLLLPIALSLLTTTAIAGSVPNQLYNKSIIIVWSVTTVSKQLPDGVTTVGTPTIERTIYISSAGRAFIRNQGSNGRSKLTTEIGPEKGSGTTFEGRTLISYGVNQDVALRATVTFNASFSACDVSITVGKANAHAKITGVDGSHREMLSASVGSKSCSVRDGNAL
jgi:hypothetical protein